MNRTNYLHRLCFLTLLCTCVLAPSGSLSGQGISINLLAAGVGPEPSGDCDKNLPDPDCSALDGNQNLTLAPGALYGFYFEWENDGLATFTEVRATDQAGELLFAPVTTPLPAGGTSSMSNFRNAPVAEGNYDYLITVRAIEENGREDIAQFRYFLTVDASLPVQLTHFAGHPLDKGKNELLWQTSAESHHDHFVVERSHDNLPFRAIGRVDAPQTSTGPIKEYRFVDKASPAGGNLYRLRQVDFDGTYQFSSIISLNTPANEAGCWPNPAVHQLYFAGDHQGPVFDLWGRSHSLRQQADGGLDVSPLAPGQYWLRTSRGVVRFLKQ
ncbi:fibronectin type III domain-containing protein [Neolewinella agarilytica]|uniref:Uncharacterized protein n=1 Tax=Neolewinella agarilytica TaxID=478744 RepID=A0A1H9EM53_9BACT|nr:hypothetical protein [Neolewinella agarilytica]SEQ26791.1 hypothetical protein SAMN05444359_107130 [Neolewinella agarilytica]